MAAVGSFSPMLPLRWSASPTGTAEPGTGTCDETGAAARADEGAGTDPRDVTDGDTGDDTDGVTGDDTGGTPPARPPAPGATHDERPDVLVRTSSRRRKTAAAFWENGRIVVLVPAHVPRADRPELVEWLVARVMAKRPGAAASDDALAARTTELADRYVDGVRPASVRWVTNQAKRWGSCSVQTGEIRLSHRLRAVPEWVLDATIVHELAHLVHADHSPDFHAIADRHPRQRDALVFLEGYSLGLDTARAAPP